MKLFSLGDDTIFFLFGFNKYGKMLMVLIFRFFFIYKELFVKKKKILYFNTLIVNRIFILYLHTFMKRYHSPVVHLMELIDS